MDIGTHITGSWLLYKIVDILIHRSIQHSSVLATGIITNVAVMVSILSAFPWVRKSVHTFTSDETSRRPKRPLTDNLDSTHHNVFERHHRFIGWLGLAVRLL